MFFIKLRKFSYIPSLLSVFIMNGCWILSNAFSASVEMIVIFVFHSVSPVFLIDLQVLHDLSVSGINLIV